MERIVCVLIGYAFGLIQTGYLYGKLRNIDIRKMGSGNAGTTNALRTLGWKAGAVTLLGDALKCILAVVVVHLIYGNSHADSISLLSMYAGMGAVIGHNYPFYLGFKGGKGIAATFGLCISTTNVYVVVIGLLVFFAIVGISRYVSLGSLIIVWYYLGAVVYLGQTGAFAVPASSLWEMYVIAGLLVLSAYYQHRQNIKRLLNGTENKLSVGKSK